MRSIATAELVPLPPEDREELPDLRSFCDAMDEHRMATLQKMLYRHQEITKQLEAIGGQLCGTKSGNLAELRGYYTYWEGRVAEALAIAIVNALNRLVSCC